MIHDNDLISTLRVRSSLLDRTHFLRRGRFVSLQIGAGNNRAADCDATYLLGISKKHHAIISATILDTDCRGLTFYDRSILSGEIVLSKAYYMDGGTDNVTNVRPTRHSSKVPSGYQGVSTADKSLNILQTIPIPPCGPSPPRQLSHHASHPPLLNSDCNPMNP